jgi:hypothetical protein
MNDHLFVKRLTRRDVLVSAAEADAGMAVTSGSSASGETAPALGWGRGCLSIFPDLASRVTILDADDDLAAQLGDGKETDGTTNRPDHQTNPALFAAPHSLSVDSKGEFNMVDWIPTGRLRRFNHDPA